MEPVPYVLRDLPRRNYRHLHSGEMSDTGHSKEGEADASENSQTGAENSGPTPPSAVGEQAENGEEDTTAEAEASELTAEIAELKKQLKKLKTEKLREEKEALKSELREVERLLEERRSRSSPPSSNRKQRDRSRDRPRRPYAPVRTSRRTRPRG